MSSSFEQLSDILFKNKDKINSNDYLVAMNSLKQIKDQSQKVKKVMLAIPYINNIHVCPIHKTFEMTTEFIYTYVGPEYKREMEVGGDFLIDEHPPTELIYKHGMLLFVTKAGLEPFFCEKLKAKIISIGDC